MQLSGWLRHPTTMKTNRRSPIVPVVVVPLCLVAALLAGCAARPGTSPGPAPTSTPSWVTDHEPVPIPPSAPSYDPSPAAVVFRVTHHAPYNPDPDEQVRSTTTTIHGDGRVDGPEVPANTVIAASEMQDLAKTAQALGLLDDPDLGAPVYDAGGVSITLNLDGGAYELTVPGAGTFTEAQQKARAAVDTFSQSISDEIRRAG